MKDIIYICLLLFALVLVSCEKRVTPFPDKGVAEALLTDNPDSLAVWLEERTDPALLPDSLKAEYGWWITRLHDRQKRSLMNDSIIHYTLRYFEKINSPRLPYAYVLAGMQKNWAGDKSKEEIEYIKKGWSLAENSCDTALFVNIGSKLARVYFLLNEHRLSVDACNRVIPYMEEGAERKMTELYTAGCCYAQLGKTDSMRLYMEEAIRLARKYDNSMEFYIVRNYIDCLNATGRNEEVRALLDNFYTRFSLTSDNDYPVKEFAYACLWMNQGKMDSVRSCLDRLDRYGKTVVDKSYQNKYRISILYITELLHAAYKAKVGQPVDLISMYTVSEMVANWEANQMGIDKERILSQNRLERSNLLLKIKEEQGRRLILYILLATGFIVAVLVYLYQRKLLKKERYLQQVKEQMRLHRIALSENEQQMRRNEEVIHALSAQLDGQDGLNDQLRDRQEEIEQIRQENNLLLREKQRLQQEMNRFVQTVPEKSIEMETYERITEQNMIFVTCAKQLSAILIGQNEYLKRLQKGEFRHLSDIDWPSVYKTLDQLFNNYTKRLRQNYPGLTDEDIQCCCLIKLQLSTSAIARLFGIASPSVTKRKQRIKERINQAKAGLIGKEQPVDVYLWGY